MKIDTGEYDMIQVCFLGSIVPALEQWLASRGCGLFRIPVDDPEELPTYGVRVER